MKLSESMSRFCPKEEKTSRNERRDEWPVTAVGDKHCGGYGGEGQYQPENVAGPDCVTVDCSMPGFPVLHHLSEIVQIHVHRVGDAI